MNLHIFQDSLGYFLNETVNRIERLDRGNNKYLNIAHAVKFENEFTDLMQLDFELLRRKIMTYGNLTNVYFHYYNYISKFCLDVLKKSNPGIKFIWVFWSSEFYNLPEFEPDLFLPFSKKYIKKTKGTTKKAIRAVLSKIKSIATGRPYYKHKALIRSYHDIDYVASFLEYDYRKIVEYAKANIKYIPFSYLSIHQLISTNLLDKSRNGSLIMVNHSSDPALNHVEVLEMLATKKITNTVFLPLAYGDKVYGDEVKVEGMRLLPGRIIVQSDFLSKDAYSEKMQEVGFAIFNIKIQQGLGNLLALIWLGVKVFLREENTAYQNLKDWGLHIYSVEQDLPTEMFLEFLPESYVAHNRKILSERFSESRVDEYYRNMLNIK